MKSKILYLMMLIVAVTFTACGDKDSEGLTRITYYPTLELEGGSTVYWDKGTTYVDPGYTSEMNGEDVTDQVTVSGTVDYNTSGIYTITYTSVTNEDGFSSSATRTVIVLDANDPIEGIYYTDADSYRIYNGVTALLGGNYQVLIINEGGYYYVEDLLGGWYCQRAGYGTNYAMEGYIYVNDDGTVELLDSYVPGWGDAAEFMSDGVWDAATGTMSWMIEYTSSAMDFYVTMYKSE